MLFFALGILAFVLFFLYEFYSVYKKPRIFSLFFAAGFVLLLSATVGLTVISVIQLDKITIRLILSGAVALVFLALLVYTLFFALPFSDTYVSSSGARVCRTGFYALCRHPGVLWFGGFYFFIWLALGGTLPLLMFAAYTSLNIAYSTFQDLWSFGLCFEDYADYKKSVPFLIPNARSIRACFLIFRRR